MIGRVINANDPIVPNQVVPYTGGIIWHGPEKDARGHIRTRGYSTAHTIVAQMSPLRASILRTRTVREDFHKTP